MKETITDYSKRRGIIGALARIKQLNETFVDRFWVRVNKLADGGCWEWTGSLNQSGYGQVKQEGKSPMCHRLTFEWKFGAIPGNLQVLHRCDNPKCVNPNHLFLGTQKDNVQDCIQKNRRRYRHGPVPKRQGENNGRAKITEAIVRRIRSTDLTKWGARTAMARELGITVGNVTGIIQFQNWKHVI